MGSLLQRAGIVLFISYVMFAAVAFIVSLLEVPALDLLGELYWSWVFFNAAMRWLQFFPAATVFGLLVFAGLILGDLELATESHRLTFLRALVVITLAAAALQGVFALALTPSVRHGAGEQLAASSMVRHYRDRFAANMREQQFALARRNAESIAIVMPALSHETDRMLSDLRQAQEAAADDVLGTADSDIDAPAAARPVGQTAAQRYQRARTAMERGDWFTAHLYGRQAFDLDPRLSSARELADEAWDEIERAARGDDRTELFERKREGLRALTDGRSIEAYYLFRDLREEYPDDQDVRRYLSEAEEQAAEIAFFVEDFDQIAGLPGENDVIYVQTGGDYEFEVIHFDRLIGAPAARYAVGVRAVGVDDDGIAYYFRAPLGAFVEGVLAVRGLDPDDPTGGFDAEYVIGSRPESLRSIIPLHASSTQLLRSSRAQSELRELTAVDFLRLLDDAVMPDFVRESVRQEIIRRLASVFTVVVVSIAAAAFALARRSLYADRPPVFALLLLPLPAFAAYLAVEIWTYSQEVLGGLLLIALPFGAALAALVAVQALFILLALSAAIRSTQ